MSSLLHQAFLYGSREEFVGSMAPFVREGLDRGDVIFGATKPSNIAAMRAELGKDAGLVELQDTAVWCTRPYERLQAFRHMVDELPPGAVLRAMGEPIWTGSSPVVRQWARYESIINLALADAPMRFICLYDSSALPDDILDYAQETHPEQVEGGSTVECGRFVPPEEFAPGLPPTPPSSAAELPLDGHQFRRELDWRARKAGLAQDRIEDFVLAAHEVVANALRHGRPPMRAGFWAQGDDLVCQIGDRGPGVADPLAGWLPPPATRPGGWGLPIARQLCDAVEIARDGSETIVTLYASLDGRVPAASSDREAISAD